MKILKGVPLVAAIALFAAAPAMAQDQSFRIFVTANWIMPQAEEDVTLGLVNDTVKGEDETGYEAGFEWRAGKIIGLEGSYMFADQGIEFGGDNVGSMDQKTITAALNFHIIPGKRFDLWVAPVVSWVDWSDFEFNQSFGGGTVPVDSQTAFGAAVGFDIGLGKTIAITGGLRYFSMDVQAENFEKFKLDPLIARVGLAFRFGTR